MSKKKNQSQFTHQQKTKKKNQEEVLSTLDNTNFENSDDSVTFHFAHISNVNDKAKKDKDSVVSSSFSISPSYMSSSMSQKEFQKLVKQYKKSKKKYQKKQRKAMCHYAKQYQTLQTELAELDEVATDLGCSVAVDLEPVLQIPYTVFLGVYDAKRARAEAKMMTLESVSPYSLEDLSPAQLAMAKQSSQVSQYIQTQFQQQVLPRLQGELSKMMFFSH